MKSLLFISFPKTLYSIFIWYIFEEFEIAKRLLNRPVPHSGNQTKKKGIQKKTKAEMGLREIYANAYDILLLLPLDINVLCDIHYSRKRGDERRTTNLRKLRGHSKIRDSK